MSRTPRPLQRLSALIGDMSCGLHLGGNDDKNLRDYRDRLITIAIEIDGLFGSMETADQLGTTPTGRVPARRGTEGEQ